MNYDDSSVERRRVSDSDLRAAGCERSAKSKGELDQMSQAHLNSARYARSAEVAAGRHLPRAHAG